MILASATRGTVAYQAERDAYRHHDGHGEEHRKPQIAPLRKPPEHERERGREKEKERARRSGLDPVRFGLQDVF